MCYTFIILREENNKDINGILSIIEINSDGEKRIIYNQEFLLCRQSIKETQDRYKILVRFCVEGLSYLIQFVEEMNKYCPTSFASVQNA